MRHLGKTGRPALPMTARQESILQFIAKFTEEEGFPPVIREIGAEFGIRTLRGVTSHLDALVLKGQITRSSTPRSIVVVSPAYGPAQRYAMLPLIFSPTPEGADFTSPAEQVLPVPRKLLGGSTDCFLLRVKGSSMAQDGINPRDIVVVKPTQHPRHGQIVVVQTDGRWFVRRLVYHSDRVVLLYHGGQEWNVTNWRVMGRVIGLMRDYEGTAF